MSIAYRLAACAPMAKNGLYVVLFNTAIAGFLGAVGFGDGFWINFVYSQCIGLPAWFLIDGSRRLLWPFQHPRRLPFLLIILASMLAATYGGTWLAASLFGHPWNLKTPLSSLLITATAGFVAVLYFWERGRTEMVERQVAEARLRLLQAQIEPHFLFNTLANLHALIAADPRRAQAMLDHLNGYLRAALAAARKERNSLGDEFALLRAYIEILAIRMDRRLRYRLELPEALAAIELPPMLLQPLVENAIKHGLEPKIEGGEVTVSASAANGSLRLRVTDDGLGLGGAATAGTGAGIVQLRERLAAVYGPAAALEIAANPAGGVTAALSLPVALPASP
jgi:hypothetical protein